MVQCLLNTAEAGSVVVKRAVGAGAAALRSEGERLRAAAHPGVVEVVASRGDDSSWELVTAHGGRPVDAVGTWDVSAVAQLAATVATTIADLHEMGVVHGRIDASHVLIAGHGQTRLCGFGPEEAVAERSPADDVAAIGELIRTLAGSPTSGRLMQIAAAATADPASSRPSARQLAGRLARELPVERSAGPRHLARRSRRVPLTTAVGAAALLCAAGVTMGGQGDGPEPVSKPARSTSSTEPGPVVTFAGRQYQVGRAGDRVALVDDDCDGTPTPVVLRPATGEIFVFEAWAPHPVHVAAIAVVPRAEALETPDGCGPVAVRRSDGSVVRPTRGGS